MQTTVSLADAARQITAGSFEGNPKWLTINRNQDVLNYAAQQASTSNPDLFNTECSVMPVIAYLTDHKARDARPRRLGGSARSRDAHNDKDRQFLLAAGSAGIEAATNIVVEPRRIARCCCTCTRRSSCCASSPSAAGAP